MKSVLHQYDKSNKHKAIKLFTLALICIITGVLFSSCGSGFSVTKRHYTKGYYVNHHNNANKTTNNTNEVLAEAQTDETASETKKVTSATSPGLVAQNDIAVSTENKIAENNSTGKNTATKDEPKSKKAIASVIKHVTHGIQNNMSTIAKVFPKSHKIGNTAREGEGYSLFWIIILILLILWAIGTISTGFLIGGIINLLLLVALILLILWLLRIV